MPNNESALNEPKRIEQLRAQARRLDFVEDEDFTIQDYTTRTHGEKLKVLVLTPQGKEKRRQLTQELFHGESETGYSVPLGREATITQLHEGDVLDINGLLAVSLIRRRTGGYVCTFTDDFSQLAEEKYKARVLHINDETGTVRIIFDHWPGEYIHYDFFLEQPNLVAVNEPISIGPECVVEFQVLADGKPHEDFLKWAKNVIQRNLLGKGNH